MATWSLQSDRYKLNTTFVGDSTIHTASRPNFLGQRGFKVQTKWKHRRNLGAGAFGVVWLEQEEGGQLRAVKRIPRDVKSVDWSRELEILAQLRNYESLFVKFLGWYEDISFVYFAMEYIKHGDLGQYLETCGLEVAKSQAKEIVSQVLEGLVVLHQQNICHRDIKPKNILIASISPIQVKIADFGLSKHQNNTSLRTRCGTLYYIAPELQGFVPKPKSKGSYTNRVDVWSLGILTYEILTLEVPFLLNVPDSDPEMELGSGGGQRLPEMNMQLFFDYCRDHERFPTESLRRSGVDARGIAFVQALLVADPRSRISAAEALKDRWLLKGQEAKKAEEEEAKKAEEEEAKKTEEEEAKKAEEEEVKKAEEETKKAEMEKRVRADIKATKEPLFLVLIVLLVVVKRTLELGLLAFIALVIAVLMIGAAISWYSKRDSRMTATLIVLIVVLVLPKS